MALIEGVGDEVTIFVAILILLIVLTLAWLSTGVADRPLVSVVVLDRRTFQQFLLRLRHVGRTVTLQTGAPEPGTAEEDLSHQGAADAPPEVPTETESTDNKRSESAVPGSVSQEETSSNTTSLQEGRGSTSSTQSTPSSESFVHVSETSSDNESDSVQMSDIADVTVPVAGDRNETATSDCEQDSELLRRRRIAFFEKNETDGNTIGVIGSTASCSTSSSQKTHSSPQTLGAEASETEQPNLENSPGTSIEPQVSEPAELEQSEETETEEARLDGHIRLRLKYLDDRQRWVQARPEETVGQFKRSHFASELADNTVVRFIYNGQELRRDGHTLASYNIVDDSVIHCLISQTSTHPTRQASTNAQEFEIGMLMYPLFGIILGLIWYSRCVYKQYFNTMSTLTLIGISFLFIVAVMASFRTAETPEHED